VAKTLDSRLEEKEAVVDVEGDEVDTEGTCLCDWRVVVHQMSTCTPR
jgi:hypothetical protein